MSFLVFYTDAGMKPWMAACTRGPVILIRPAYRDDAGLLAHEKVHRRQWLRTLGMHSILYLLSRSYRLSAELEAYTEQARHYPDDRAPLFAQYIATRYGLDITPEAALCQLRGKPTP